MKSVIFALALVAIAAAVPVEKEPVKILRSDITQDPSGSYSFNFETEDGTSRQETGDLKELINEDNKPINVVVVRGFYSYINDEGKSDTVNYWADESGYHVEGENVPKSVLRQ